MSWIVDILKDVPTVAVLKERLTLQDETFAVLIKEKDGLISSLQAQVTELQSQVNVLQVEHESLREQNSQQQNKALTEDPKEPLRITQSGNLLADVEVQILLQLFDSPHPIAADRFVFNPPITHGERQLHLTRLFDTGYVGHAPRWGVRSIAGYFIEQKGREYLHDIKRTP